MRRKLPTAFHVMSHAYFLGPLLTEHMVNSNLNTIASHYQSSKHGGQILLLIWGFNCKAHTHTQGRV